MLDIKIYEKEIKKTCVNLKVKKLDIFGSSMTNEFGPNSDIDFLAEFNEVKDTNYF